MLQLETIVLGEAAGPYDVYLHPADIQTQVCVTWAFARVTGWEETARILSEFEDLLMLALDDSSHPLLTDLRFLTSLALSHHTLTREAAARAAA